MAGHPTTPRQRPETVAKPLQEVRENLRGLESRLDGLASDRRELAARDPSDPRLRKLKAMVEDLANDVRDQRAHATAALKALESFAAGRVPARDALGPVPVYPPRYLRFPRRVAGYLLRRARALARRLRPTPEGSPRTVSPRTGPRVELVTGAGEAARRPSLTVLLERTRDVPGASFSVPAADGVEWMCWEREEGSYQVFNTDAELLRHGRAMNAVEIRDAARGEYCVRLGLAPDELPPTALDVAALVLAAEPLAFFHLRFDSGEDENGRELLLAHHDVWHPLEHLDLGACERWQRSPVLGKTASLERHGLPAPLPLEPAAARRLRSLESYFVNPAKGGAPAHSLRDLDKASPAQAVPRPAVGVLLATQPWGGVERLLADLGRSVGERFELLLFLLESTSLLDGERLRDLARNGFRVYPLAALEGPSLGPAVSFLLSRHAKRRLLYVGDPRRLTGKIPDAARRFSGEAWFEVPLEAEPLLGGVPRGKGSEVGGAVRLAGDGVPWSVCEELLRRTAPTDAEVAGVRARLDLPKDALLVTMASDLVAAARPEDFVALAARFREDPGFAFLLLGDGPHAGAVEDMRRYLDPPNFRHLHRVDDVGGVLAASDVFCTTSEFEPLPSRWLDALALGRPVIAAAIDGLAEGPCGCVVPRVGDLPAFESAVRALADPATRRTYGENARRLLEQRLSDRPAHEAWTELFQDGPTS